MVGCDYGQSMKAGRGNDDSVTGIAMLEWQRYGYQRDLGPDRNFFDFELG